VVFIGGFDKLNHRHHTLPELVEGHFIPPLTSHHSPLTIHLLCSFLLLPPKERTKEKSPLHEIY
jgi:hypothetical protein